MSTSRCGKICIKPPKCLRKERRQNYYSRFSIVAATGAICTKLIVLRSEVCSDWPAIQCVVISRIPQAWEEMLRDLPYCDTKRIKPITNEAFVKSSGDIITDYNESWLILSFYMVNITMSAFVIRETTNNKRYSSLLKTRVWIASSRNVFTDCESEASDYKLLIFIDIHFIMISRKRPRYELSFLHYDLYHQNSLRSYWLRFYVEYNLKMIYRYY